MGAGSIAAIILGSLLPVVGVITFFVTRKMFLKAIKANPPISEKQIRAMFLSMGRKPSEAQIQQVLKQMKNAK